MGLRIWPAGPGAVQTAPAFHGLPLRQVAFFPITPIARTPDGRIMALLRGPSVYLWRSEAPDRLVPVVPPPEAPDAGDVPGLPPGAVGLPRQPAAARPTRFRAIQIAPGGDRLYLIDSPDRLHTWDIAGIAGRCRAPRQRGRPGLPPSRASPASPCGPTARSWPSATAPGP